MYVSVSGTCSMLGLCGDPASKQARCSQSKKSRGPTIASARDTQQVLRQRVFVAERAPAFVLLALLVRVTLYAVGCVFYPSCSVAGRVYLFLFSF